MPDFFLDHPGRLYALATLLPLMPTVAILLAGAVRNLRGPAGLPPVWGGYLSVVTVACSAVLSLIGLAQRDGSAWQESWAWFRAGPSIVPEFGTILSVGYFIDTLAAYLFTMVAVVSTLIFLFSLGYMREERDETVEDHEAHVRRRGRHDRFFAYLSLFVASMFNLLIADNLFQVFVGWELVGVSSFLLISFYSERAEAGNAATKAFIVNRVGDAGFLIGIAVAWTTFGTLNIQELIRLVGLSGSGLSPEMATLMGLGIFLGCVGKSAQVPLHVWLPDAMAGPTPVSALIHAATMVAAGVYLVGRAFPLFPPDVLMVIAYIGAVTMLLTALIACIQTDIKKVMAYSTCSQLGFMMLALGIGGWAAGEFHLLTHACFKALLFLGAGSVIIGLHHEQNLKQMGGLRQKMPITSITMLIGVLAISGFPLLSGWYSKDMILSQALGFSLDRSEHALLFFVPLLTAGLTAFYMVRMWLLAFAGQSRSKSAEHAKESGWVMTVPLILLAVASVGIGWGWPVWDAESSYLGQQFERMAPAHRSADFSGAVRLAHQYHLVAGGLALLVAAGGAFVACRSFVNGTLLHPALPLRDLIEQKWYFDAVYAKLIQQPTLGLADLSARADRKPGRSDGDGSDPDARHFDGSTLDGWLNGLGNLCSRFGTAVRQFQSGQLRGYVLVLGLTLAVLLWMLAVQLLKANSRPV